MRLADEPMRRLRDQRSVLFVTFDPYKTVRRPMRAHLIIAAMLLLATLDAGAQRNPLRAHPIDGFFATYANSAKGLEQWLAYGGDPNVKNQRGESLLYVATGPKGGVAVLRVLLQAGANPNVGHGKYTPLMNAASWANAEAVEILLAAGADPVLTNEEGKSAAELVGNAGGKEQPIIARLRAAERRK